jgi:signal transduction histidine kinase
MPDWAWALIGGALSLAWFFISIAVGTSYFDAGNQRPSLTDMQVWGSVALLLIQAFALLWNGRHPIIAYWVVFVSFLGMIGLVSDGTLSTSLTLLLAMMLLIARTNSRVWVPTLLIALAADVSIYLGFAAMGSQVSLIAVLTVLSRATTAFLPPVLGGLLIVALQRQTALVADRAAVREASAALAERNRMARELHDVSAHHLSVLTMQSKSALRARELGEEVTTTQLDAIRVASERALNSLREVIGLLREPGDAWSPFAAAPTLGSLADLIESVRQLHPALDLTVEGKVDDIPPAASFACYRIIQESLTNARKHAAGAPIRIRVRRVPDELLVEITNDQGEPTADDKDRAGFGVLGMRERAVLLGGSLDAGHTTAGGWSTRARIPLERGKAAV